MSTELRKEIQEYSDKRILNTLKSQDFFDKETVAIAKEIAFERGIVNEESLKNINLTAARERSTREHESANRFSTGGAIGIGTVILIILFILKIVLRSMN
jgi:hypothetical protein